MATPESAGQHFRQAMEQENPLQVVGVVNALCAKFAADAGFGALYLSGAGVANASRGLPDLGLTTLEDVLTDVRRITAATRLPLLVDADTGFADAAETVRELELAGAAGVHIEDQVEAKRCGHLPGKQLVSTEAMVERLRAAAAGRAVASFIIMARTDAVAVEGMDAAIQRARRYVHAGADMIFAEALTDLDAYRRFTRAVEVPVLANLTEFGRTPLLTLDELRSAGVRLALYPLSAFRAMNAAAQRVYRTLRAQGTQRGLLPEMQTREELYRVLDYNAWEKQP